MSKPDTFYPPPRLQQPSTPPVVFAWSAQSTDDTLLFLEDLELWVGWLADRYRLDHRLVPDCWRQHPELVEELSALHLAWEGSFSITASYDAPLLWHERFANSRVRISEWVARLGCRPGSHRSAGT